MRILHLSTFDDLGGAALAAVRLHEALLAAGVDSHLHVQFRRRAPAQATGPTGRLARAWALARPEVDRLPLAIYPGRSADFHLNWLPVDLARILHRLEPDLVHLHWIGEGFVGLGDLACMGRPLVWTLHDQWPLTGGCHYAGDCRAWTAGCGRCPQLGSRRRRDLSAWTWRRKARLWPGVRLHPVAPSRWMADLAAQSPLFGHRPATVLPNALDTDRFRPLDRTLARQWLGLPTDRPLVLFGAVHPLSDRRKGCDLLTAAMHHEAAGRWPPGTTPVVFGAPDAPPPWPRPPIAMGRLTDEVALALLYAACDLFVLPSRQDNLPNTVAEAMACGLPVVAFAVGGVPEMVSHRVDGYLARPEDPGDLARGIGWVLADDERRERLGRAARQRACRHYAAPAAARRHITFYRSLHR